MERRAAIYVRTRAGTDGADLAAQEERCRRSCADQGWRVACVFAEAGSNGRGANRPQFAALRAAIRQRTVDVVVATRLDRIIRGLCDTGDFVTEAHEAGVELCLLDGPSHADLVAEVAAAEARYYRKQRRNPSGCAMRVMSDE